MCTSMYRLFFVPLPCSLPGVADGTRHNITGGPPSSKAGPVRQGGLRSGYRDRQCKRAARLGSGYPGHFGALPMAYVTGMVERLLPLITAHFDTGPIRPGRVRGNFSLLPPSGRFDGTATPASRRCGRPFAVRHSALLMPGHAWRRHFLLMTMPPRTTPCLP